MAKGNIQTIKLAGLYQIVFHTRAVRIAVFLVLMFFLLHPAVPVFANEFADDTASESADATEVAQKKDVTEETESIDITDEEVVSEPEETLDGEERNDNLVESDTDEGESLNEEVSTPDEDGQSASVVEQESDTSEVSGGSSGTGSVTVTSTTTVSTHELTETETTSTTTEAVNPAPEEEVAEAEEDAPEEVLEALLAAASEEKVDDTEEDVLNEEVPEPTYYEITQQAYEDDSHLAFLRNQCVSMGDGAYHCFDASYTLDESDEEALYVSRDGDGDKEIYLNIDGKVTQITHNKLDDDAPYYDALSDTVVWHRQEAGGYRVYAYDGDVETLLSNPGINSMEPHRSGEYTVWQSWIEDAWRVVLSVEAGKTTVLPTRGGQNIAPQVEGGYVIWTESAGTTHAVAVYEIATGLVSYIEDSESARVMNPRFVLVYDTRFDNGDVVTQGYDAETGEIIPLAAAAPVKPTEIPSATQTGEVVALLATKSSSRDESIDGEIDTDFDVLSVATSTPTATTSVQADTGTTTLIVADAVLTASTTLPLTDFDIIVEPYVATGTASSTQE